MDWPGIRLLDMRTCDQGSSLPEAAVPPKEVERAKSKEVERAKRMTKRTLIDLIVGTACWIALLAIVVSVFLSKKVAADADAGRHPRNQ